MEHALRFSADVFALGSGFGSYSLRLMCGCSVTRRDTAAVLMGCFKVWDCARALRRQGLVRRSLINAGLNLRCLCYFCTGASTRFSVWPQHPILTCPKPTTCSAPGLTAWVAGA